VRGRGVLPLSCLSLALVACLAGVFFNPWIALFATAFLAFSWAN